MENFLGILVTILCIIVILKFVSFCIRARTVRYQDWAREQKRLQMLETVRKVRAEMGDYGRARSNPNRPARARPAARRRKQSA